MSTAEYLAGLGSDGNRYELISGEIRMMSPAGAQHGRIAMRISISLGLHVDENNLGATFAAETGFRIASNPDTVRAPGASFVSNARLVGFEDDTGYLPLAPDLAVEVVSPNDSFSAVEEKAFSWLNAGAQLVLIAVPESQSIHAYRSKTKISVHGVDETFDASDVVAGWKLEIGKIFQSN